MSSTGTKSGRTPGSAEFRLDEIVRSDALPDLRGFRQRIPALKQVTEEPLQIRLVLDANIIQRELRWRLRHRRHQEARSALQEAMDSGTLIPFAPTALIQEIEEHILDIAEYARVLEQQVREEWAKIRDQIHFHEPDAAALTGDFVDPEDAPYRQVCIELGAHAVYTRDSHFKSMDVPLIMLDLDEVFRKYARANSIKLAFHIGSTFTITISINVLNELMKLGVRGIRKIPTPLKIAFLVAIGAALIHPRSRAKIVEVGTALRNKLKNPKFRALLSSLVLQIAEAHHNARAAGAEIKAALPPRRKRTALVFIKEILVIEKGPLPVPEIEERILAAGYVTRSQSFESYLKRVLRDNRAFLEISPGQWTLRATPVTAVA